MAGRTFAWGLLVGSLVLAKQQGSCETEICDFPTKLEDLKNPYLSYILDAPKTRERPMGAKFRNLRTHDVVIYWDNGSSEGVYNGIVQALRGSSTLSYEGHSFLFYKRLPNGEKGDFIIRHTMEKGKAIYVVPQDDPKVTETEFYKNTMEEIKFFQRYYEENQMPWLSHFPRGPPILPLWPADHLGQVHTITSKNGFLKCDPESASSCAVPEMTLDLNVISLKPRVFFIKQLLSKFELDHILELGENTVSRSTVGQGAGSYTSNTRTSRTGWLSRKDSSIVDHVYKRFADVLNISDSKLHFNVNAEKLQIVHYKEGQEYTPHHDFGDSGRPNARFLTLFVYIRAAEAGGGTSFPNAYGGRGMKVEPQSGDALLWYNMLPDGNGDELSLHAGMPVLKGEKWGCNLWVWDPSY